MNGFWEALRRQFDGQDRLAALLVNLLWTLIALLVAAVGGRILRGAVRRLLTRGRVPPNVVQLARHGVTLLVAVVTIGVMLSIFGVPPTAVLTFLSLSTAALVFAFHDMLKNLIAGIYLLIEHPFTVGHRIRVKDTEGTVEAMNMRTTEIRTEEGEIAIVPNNVIFTEIVRNRSISGVVHTALILSDVADEPDDINRKVEETLAGMADIVTTPAPRTRVLSVRDDAAEVSVEFWHHGATDGDDPTQRVIAALRETFPDADIASNRGGGKGA